MSATQVQATSPAAPHPLANVQTITILPIALPTGYGLDDREKLEQNIYKILVRKLALKGYVLDRPRNWQPPKPWTAEALGAMPMADLAALAPKDAEHVALLLVESISENSQVIQSKATTSLSVRLIEPASATVLWQNRGDGRHYENLFAGYLTMMITPDKYFALEKAFKRLFEDLPERPE